MGAQLNAWIKVLRKNGNFNGKMHAYAMLENHCIAITLACTGSSLKEYIIQKC